MLHSFIVSVTLMKKLTFKRDRFIHSPESWEDLWLSVFTELEGVQFAYERVSVKAELKEAFEHGRVTGQMMHWSVNIL